MKTCLKNKRSLVSLNRKLPLVPLDALISIVRFKPAIESLRNPITACDALSEICTIFLTDDNAGFRADAENFLVEILLTDEPGKMKFLALRALTHKKAVVSFETHGKISVFRCNPANAKIDQEVLKWKR